MSATASLAEVQAKVRQATMSPSRALRLLGRGTKIGAAMNHPDAKVQALSSRVSWSRR
ncbi:hypothetical protein [Nannocystis pusilla]|uniref:hypothetical protein n=1 Tax=Nannocystis pusilla TaxID=889268 RepID=UPI003DA215E3